MKFTMLLTQRCNLACTYCYINKRPEVLSLDMAKRIVDFIYRYSQQGENIDIGFFGGEPLLEFELMQAVTKMIVSHDCYDEQRIIMRVVSNGTIFSEEIADFFQEYKIGLGISCDGPPSIQNRNRLFINGNESADLVEKNLGLALERFPLMPVNAVFDAQSLYQLPQTIDYLSGLRVKNIHLNPDICSSWTPEDCAELQGVYNQIGEKYIQYYLDNDPHYISLIDTKIVVLLRGGYRPEEKCGMGKTEFAFAPSGNIYPCERLVQGDDGGSHCIGHVDDLDFTPQLCHGKAGSVQQNPCHECSLQEFCMHWCGCTNYFASGDYNRVNYFLCYSEKAAIQSAMKVIEETGKVGVSFSNHLQGTPLMSIIGEVSSP